MCVLDVIGVSSIFRLTRKNEDLTGVLPTFVLTCEKFYYEVRKREVQRRLVNECRCDERLKDRATSRENLPI